MWTTGRFVARRVNGMPQSLFVEDEAISKVQRVIAAVDQFGGPKQHTAGQ